MITNGSLSQSSKNTVSLFIFYGFFFSKIGEQGRMVRGELAGKGERG
jgi:hypothetical protein